jgi:hypothetical protein
MNRLGLAAVPLVVLSLAAGCGGSGGGKGAAPSAATTSATPAPATRSAPAAGPSALQAEANAAAAGDIPDNQVFLTFHDALGGYSMKYPEGWAQQGAGLHVTFRDKNNIARVVVARGTSPTKASVAAELARLRGAQTQALPRAMTISGRPAFKVVYSTESAPNGVTGRRVKLVVDRYYLWKTGRRAVVDLGTPVGVDNVDAYRLMIESFRWS